MAVPGITFDEHWLFELGRFIGSLRHAKALDVLPYHTMGEPEYRQMGLPNPLERVPPLSEEEAAKARRTILLGIREGRGRPCSGF